MNEDGSFTPAIDRLNSELNLLKDGADSRRSAIVQLENIHEKLDREMEELDSQILERRCKLSELEYKMNDRQLRLTEIHKRHKSAVGEGTKLQRDITAINDSIHSMRLSTQNKLDNMDKHVESLSEKFQKSACLNDDGSGGCLTTGDVQQALIETRQVVDTLTQQLSDLRSGHSISNEVKLECLRQSRCYVDELRRTVQSCVDSAVASCDQSVVV